MSLAGRLEQKTGLRFDGISYHFDGPVVFNGGISGGVGRGKVFFLDPENGSDNYDGKTPGRAKATLAAAYALLTADQNDVLFVIDEGTNVSLTAQFDWAKDRTHLIGIGKPPGRIRKGVVIANTATDADGQFQVTANGCYFRNICWAHQGSAAALINVEITGDDNVFDECQFRNMDNAATAAAATMLGVRLNGCNRPTFYRCTFGGTNVERTASAADMTIGPGTITGLQCTDCIWIANLNATADASHAFIETVADADLGDFALLERPTFINSGANANLPDAMTIGVATAGFFLLRSPLLVYITDIADNEEKVWVQNEGQDTTPGKFTGIAINPDVT